MKKERIIQRFLEILPGFFSWNVILFPYWGIFVIPNVVAYFILVFNLFWFYQSFLIAISAFISHLRMQAAMRYDWLGDIKSFPDWQRVHHVVIIPTYKEPVYILERTIQSLADQDLPKSQLDIVLAMEDKEDEVERLKKVKILKSKFGKTFNNFLVTVHKLVPGEAVGKASNEKHAAIEAKRILVDEKGMDLAYLTVTSCDADHKYFPKHFSCLTFKFLDNPNRYKHFWQPAVLFYNNIWELPAITRVPNTLSSIWNLAVMSRRDRLINTQNYSLSFKLLHDIGYWDPDKIPEDWGIFFKALYEAGGGVEVEPLYLPLYADAAQSTSLFKTLKVQYEQLKRWAWGVSDTPWWIKGFFFKKDVPFWDKLTRVLYATYAHFMWPVNWFTVTIGLTLPTILNPAFGRTSLGYMVPRISSFVLTISLVFLVVSLLIDNVYKPKPATLSVWRKILYPLEFVLMPVSGFFFSALPGIDAHTRLMLGKYLEYKVTEKV